MVSAQVRLQKAVRHPLYAHIRMCANPFIGDAIILKHSISRRPVVVLANICDRNGSAAIAAHSKSHRIARALLRQMRACGGIAHIAELSQFKLAGSFIRGSCRAHAMPPRTQRKSRRMRPVSIVTLLRRHEIGAGHEFCANCTRWQLCKNRQTSIPQSDWITGKKRARTGDFSSDRA